MIRRGLKIGQSKKGHTMKISCGVIVTDGTSIVLGHSTGSPANIHDIPKGMLEEGENPIEAALRELYEETGLTASAGDLQNLGEFAYLRDKKLYLFLWKVSKMPDIKTLKCHSFFDGPNGEQLPEFNRYSIVPWQEVSNFVREPMYVVLKQVQKYTKE